MLVNWAFDMNGEEAERENLKIVLLGDIYVGKTSISNRFVQETFIPNVESTVRIAFQSKNVDLSGDKLTLRIWDTAGQEKYRSLAPIYYQNSDVAVVVYDVTREDSVETLKYWLDELQANTHPMPVLAVLGNKIDMAADRVISTERGQALAKEAGALFQETSAVTGEGIERIFIEAAQKGWNNKQQRMQAEKDHDIIQVNQQQQQQKSTDCAC